MGGWFIEYVNIEAVCLHICLMEAPLQCSAVSLIISSADLHRIDTFPLPHLIHTGPSQAFLISIQDEVVASKGLTPLTSFLDLEQFYDCISISKLTKEALACNYCPLF